MAAPVAVANQVRNNGRNTVARVSGSDRIASIRSITDIEDYATMVNHILEPDSCPRLKMEARGFQYIKWVKVDFVIAPRTSTANTGGYVAGFVNDAADLYDGGEEDVARLQANRGSVSTSIWKGCRIVPNIPKKQFYTSPSEDIRLSSPGRLIVLCDGAPTTNGSLSVICNWTVELSGPTLESDVDTIQGFTAARGGVILQGSNRISRSSGTGNTYWSETDAPGITEAYLAYTPKGLQGEAFYHMPDQIIWPGITTHTFGLISVVPAMIGGRVMYQIQACRYTGYGNNIQGNSANATVDSNAWAPNSTMKPAFLYGAAKVLGPQRQVRKSGSASTRPTFLLVKPTESLPLSPKTLMQLTDVLKTLKISSRGNSDLDSTDSKEQDKSMGYQRNSLLQDYWKTFCERIRQNEDTNHAWALLGMHDVSGPQLQAALDYNQQWDMPKPVFFKPPLNWEEDDTVPPELMALLKYHLDCESNTLNDICTDV